MKSLKSLMLAIGTIMASASALTAQEMAYSDTLTVKSPDLVTISQRADTVCIRIAGKEAEPDFRYERELVLDDTAEGHITKTSTHNNPLSWDFSVIENQNTRHSLSMELFNKVHLGFPFLIGRPSEMKGRSAWRSVEIDLQMLSFDYRPGNSKYKYSLCEYIGYKQIGLKGSTYFSGNPDGIVSLGTYPEGVTDKNSMLRLVYTGFSFEVSRQMNSTDQLTFGIDFQSPTLYNSCLHSYNDVNGKKKVEMDWIGRSLRRNHFGFRAEYELGGIGLYMKWEPWSIFHTGKGPDFGTMSIGYTLGF